jgi:hypothetical protein
MAIFASRPSSIVELNIVLGHHVDWFDLRGFERDLRDWWHQFRLKLGMFKEDELIEQRKTLTNNEVLDVGQSRR